MAGVEKRLSDLERVVTQILQHGGAEPTPRITCDLEACGREFERFVVDDLAGLSDEHRTARLEQRQREVVEWTRVIVALEAQR